MQATKRLKMLKRNSFCGSCAFLWPKKSCQLEKIWRDSSAGWKPAPRPRVAIPEASRPRPATADGARRGAASLPGEDTRLATSASVICNFQ